MSYKDTNITNPGTSIKYGADDMEIIARLFNGVTSGPHPVTIKSSNKWGFWDNIMFVRNQADTFNTTIRGAATLTNNWTLALPSQTANDTLAAIGLTNVWAVKQQMEQGLTLKQQSSPSNPASTYHHLFMNSSQHLVRRNSSGVEVDYDNQIFNGSSSVLKDYSARVFKIGSTYFAYDNLGNIISQGSVFETVAQAALNGKGSILFAGPTLSCSGSFNGLSVFDKTHIVVERGCTIDVPQGYTGHFMEIADVDKVILEVNGLITEAGTPARNWNCFVFTSGSMPVMNSHIMHAHIANAKNALWIAADGANAKVETNSFNHITTENCRKGVLFEVANGGTINMNMFMDFMISPLLGTTTNGFKDVSGDMNEFHGCMVMDNDGSIVEMNILNSANNTLLIGGNIGMLGGSTFVDASLTTSHFNAALQLRLDSGFFKMRNTAGTFTTTVTNPTQTGNFNLIIPSLTENSTIAILEDHQFFREGMTIERGSDDVLDLHRDDGAVGDRVTLDLQLDDSTGATTNYGRIAAEIFDPTNTSEDGLLRFYVSIAGTLANCLTIDQTGALLFGGPNARIKFAETGLTAVRTYTMPDADGTLLVSGGSNQTLTAPLTITETGTNDDILYLYHDVNTNGESVQLNFDLDNSVGTKLSYCDFSTSIVDNTSGSEDGAFSIRVVKAGTKVEMFRIQNSITSLYNDATSANGTNTELDFLARDSTASEAIFAAIRSEVIDNTNGSEDGKLEFLTMEGGTLTEAMTIGSNGEVDILGGGLECKDDGAADLLDLYRTDNVATNSVNINFYLEDSTNAKTLYGRLLTKIVSNTNGSEDGSMHFAVRSDDVLLERMILNDTGHLEITSKTTEPNLLSLYRDANSISNVVDINFDLEDSASNRTTYTRLESEIVDNTNGSEDGLFTIGIMKAGTIRNTHNFYQEGHIDCYRFDNAIDDYIAVGFFLNDSTNARTAYSEIKGAIEDATNGSEDGYFVISNVRGGTMNRNFKLDNTGRIFIGRDSTNMRGVSSYIVTTTDDVVFSNSSGENTLISQIVKGNVVGVDGHIIIKGHGQLVQNQATGTTYTFRIKVGGTTIWAEAVGGSLAQSATARPFMFEFRLYPSNQSSTTARMSGYWMMNDTTAPTTGVGSAGDDEGQVMANIRATGISWTFANDTTISLTCQMSVANAATEIQLDGFTMELAPT